MKKWLVLAMLVSMGVGTGCRTVNTAQGKAIVMTQSKSGWEKAFDGRLPYLGHRNWILVVDKAYPAQSGSGIEVIDTGRPLGEVLAKVVQKLRAAPHVAPVYYTDRELAFLPEALMPGVGAYRKTLEGLLAGSAARSILHDDVFPKIDGAAKLFKVLVLKTEETIAYSSVFIELDCAYWSPENEKKLRAIMKGGK